MSGLVTRFLGQVPLGPVLFSLIVVEKAISLTRLCIPVEYIVPAEREGQVVVFH